MRTSEILLVLGALTTTGFACTPRTASEATEVPVGPARGAEASCRHELGRCGGHTPGDGACGGEARATTAPASPLDQVVEPGQFAEINLEMGEGSTIEVAFAGEGGPLEWNVHSHEGDNVTIHAEGAAAEGKVRFAAPRAGLYSYLWKNSGRAPVRLSTRLSTTGTVRVQSIHPAP